MVVFFVVAVAAMCAICVERSYGHTVNLIKDLWSFPISRLSARAVRSLLIVARNGKEN